ncbi:MAG: hypothetical protein ACYDIC_15500 [Desulfobaccales bacterium]
MRITHEIPVEGGQKFQVDRFRPADALGIANLYYSIYGPDYPFDTYYIPERIREENQSGNIYSVVARTPGGDIIAHGALYRSSPPYENLYELGQYVVLKNYRDTFAAYKINQYIAETLLPQVRPAGIFGEAVCSHVATQKASALMGMKAIALEADLMPAAVYAREEIAAGRVSCLIQFRSFADRPHEVFIPASYREQIAYILSDLDISRIIHPSYAAIPRDSRSETTVKFFPHAGVARSNVLQAGGDFEPLMEKLEQEAKEQGLPVLQIFLNLGSPWVGHAVEDLRQRGYFLSGYLPRWFDTDGLLVQKLVGLPHWDGIQLFDTKAARILEMVQTDWEDTPRRS